MFFIRENDSGNRNRDHLSESVLELNDEEDEDGSCPELKSGESELESRSEEDKNSNRERTGIKYT